MESNVAQREANRIHVVNFSFSLTGIAATELARLVFYLMHAKNTMTNALGKRLSLILLDELRLRVEDAPVEKFYNLNIDIGIGELYNAIISIAALAQLSQDSRSKYLLGGIIESMYASLFSGVNSPTEERKDG